MTLTLISERTKATTNIDEIVVFVKGCLVQGASFSVAGQELPADRETEGIETVVINEMRHLASTIRAYSVGISE